MKFTPDDVLQDWVSQVRSYQRRVEGDPNVVSRDDAEAVNADEKARLLISDFWVRNVCKSPQSQITTSWLSECLDAILEHEDPYLSLGLLKRQKGKPKDRYTPVDVIFWVKLAEARGYSKAEAKALAAESFWKDLKTIEAYLRESGPWSDNMDMDADWEAHFAQPTRDRPPRPLPPPKPRRT